MKRFWPVFMLLCAFFLMLGCGEDGEERDVMSDGSQIEAGMGLLVIRVYVEYSMNCGMPDGDEPDGDELDGDEDGHSYIIRASSLPATRVRGSSYNVKVTNQNDENIVHTAWIDEDKGLEVQLPVGRYRIEYDDWTRHITLEDGLKSSTSFTHIYCDADKPNIYLYPEAPTQVDVTLDLCDGCYLKQSIPDYGTGWSVWAEPDGTLDAQYGYLFYEAAVRPDFSLREGWSVSGDTVMDFFADNLSAYGFNAQETIDFVDYWRTHLPAAPYYAVFPLVQDAIDPMAALAVSPEPDSVFRLWYVVYPRPQEDDLPEPEVAPMPRTGFVVTEWGVMLGDK